MGNQSDQRVVVARNDALTDEELEEFSEIVKQSGLEEYTRIDKSNRIDRPRLTIVKPLPLQKLPLVGIGIDDQNRLMLVTIDRRQLENPGVTIKELAIVLKENGAVTVGLGSAGGDVAFLLKSQGKISVLNSPSNSLDGKKVKRRVFSFLTVS